MITATLTLATLYAFRTLYVYCAWAFTACGGGAAARGLSRRSINNMGTIQCHN